MDSLCRLLFSAAYRGVYAKQCVMQALSLNSDNRLTVGNRTYQLHNNVYIAAFGKAAIGMVDGAEKQLGDHIVQGIASVPIGLIDRYKRKNFKTIMYEGAENNLPDQKSMQTSELIEQMVIKLTSDDILLALISGGGSALLSSPIDGIALSDKVATIKLLMHNGATIDQLNTVRQHLSRLKGGKLAQIAYPAEVIALIVSDVIDNPMHLIASGPTVAIHTTRIDCLNIINQLNLMHRLPKSVQDLLNQQVSVVDAPINTHCINNVIIADNRMALNAAADQARKSGYDAAIIRANLNGESRIIGRQFAQFIHLVFNQQMSIIQALKESMLLVDNCHVLVEPIDWNSNSLVLLFGGETTVQMVGSGIGGRNQEMGLSFLIEYNRVGIIDDCSFAFLSGGTDGQDGPTLAAGVVIADNNTILNANQLETAQYALNENNSFEFFAKYNEGSAHLITGPTGTNVMDIQCVVLRRS